ncbi:MAG TPA: putative baseplate assembly protein [Thermoanaerobaculia bacterium]|nr:putative baseplate assembly protein [Thermoanaerobaculia bacterium]
MPLPLPVLDDRRWADLVEEGRSLIPLYAPGWTDHNVHDPGITLMELLAWMADMDLYRIDRVPAAHVRKFLALVGCPPRPPQGARTVVAFRSGGPQVELPVGRKLEAQDLAGRWTPFRTLTPVTVVPLELRALQTGGPQGIEDWTARWRRGEAVPLLGEEPAPGAALYLGFDRPLPDAPVTLYFGLAGGRSGGDERERLIEEARRAAEPCPPPGPVSPCRCGKDKEEDRKEARETPPEEASKIPPHRSARTVWEIQVAPGVWWRLDPGAGEIVDESRSLTLDGRVVVNAPADMVPARIGPVKENLHYLRCLLTGGSFDAAPTLAHVLVNGVAVEQAEDAEESIGTGSGEPSQRLSLAQPAVQDGKVELRVAGEADPWEARTDFDHSDRTGSHFALEPQQGVLTFGDGEAGRRLPSGATVSASYSSTRGAEGNLPESRPWRVPGMDLAVEGPVPALGGAAAETLALATARAVESLERPERAVTLADYERLALETPGVRLARAEARANLDPAVPCLHATGVVTVLIVPFLPKSRPTPSEGTRRAVARYLGRRRLIGTRIVVAGPRYTEVAVRATVRPLPGVDPVALRARIVEALDRFFHPLTWPFGRDVYRSEVLEVLDGVAGVDHVLSLELIAGGGEPVCGNVCIGPLGLVAAGRHEIETGVTT